MPGHHQTKRRIGSVWEVARPLRDTSWWHRWRSERVCRKATNHCWHLDGYVDWWCCMCSAETDGYPAQRCVHCDAADLRELSPADRDAIDDDAAAVRREDT